jgi:phage shock protein A
VSAHFEKEVSVFRLFQTLMRGFASEAAERVIDHQGLRIVQQQLRDAATGLQEGWRALTQAMAREVAARRNLEQAEREHTSREQQAAAALKQGDEALALRVADRIVEIEQDMQNHRADLRSAQDQVRQLRASIGAAERRLKDAKRRFAAAKSTAALQSTDALATKALCHSALSEAEALLDRINGTQQSQADELAAAKTLSAERDGSALDAALVAAGIAAKARQSAEDVLARIRAGLTQPAASPLS